MIFGKKNYTHFKGSLDFHPLKKKILNTKTAASMAAVFIRIDVISHHLKLLFRRKVKRNRFMFEVPPVGTVTKGFVFRKSAATQGHHIPPSQVIGVSIFIDYLHVP